MPIPKVRSLEGIHDAASTYLAAASSQTDSAGLQKLLMRVDCEVLKLYSLPLALEQSVLTLFTDWERVGVSFKQTGYLTKELSGRLYLSDFLQFEADWLATNRERGKLIDKNIAGALTAEELIRLDMLQAYADYHLEKVTPRPSSIFDSMENKRFPNTQTKGNDV